MHEYIVAEIEETFFTLTIIALCVAFVSWTKFYTSFWLSGIPYHSVCLSISFKQQEHLYNWFKISFENQSGGFWINLLSCGVFHALWSLYFHVKYRFPLYSPVSMHLYCECSHCLASNQLITEPMIWISRQSFQFCCVHCGKHLEKQQIYEVMHEHFGN